MLAVATMDPTVQMLFFAVAVVLFICAAVGIAVARVNFIAAGLASFAIPFFWNALAAS